MTTGRLLLAAAAALALAGCRARTPTSLERKEAASMVSEAAFAVTLRDWGRAEGLYARAAALCPDSGDTWLNLALARVRLGDHGGARSAYKRAQEAYADVPGEDPAYTDAVVRRAYALVALGRPDEARRAVRRASAAHPDDRRLRAFVDADEVAKMLADPAVQANAP